MFIPGAPSSAMVKRLKYIGQCLEELSSLAITGTDDTNPAAAYTALGDQITLRPVVSPEAVRAGRLFQQQFLEELPGLMVRPGEALRHHLAWYGPHHVSSSVSSSMLSATTCLQSQVRSSTLHRVPSSMRLAKVCSRTSAAASNGCCVLESGCWLSSLQSCRLSNQLNRSQKAISICS